MMHKPRVLFASLCAVALLSEGACATFATPQRCEQAAAGLTLASQLLQVFIASGIEEGKAVKLAQAVATGQMLLAVACAQAPSSPPVAPVNG